LPTKTKPRQCAGGVFGEETKIKLVLYYSAILELQWLKSPAGVLFCEYVFFI
jgi:hypothetical protein